MTLCLYPLYDHIFHWFINGMCLYTINAATLECKISKGYLKECYNLRFMALYNQNSHVKRVKYEF